ncbi:MAG: hypothetical protein U1E16_01465 [Hyphomicrobiales bacterium]
MASQFFDGGIRPSSNARAELDHRAPPNFVRLLEARRATSACIGGDRPRPALWTSICGEALVSTNTTMSFAAERKIDGCPSTGALITDSRVARR